MRLIQRFLKTDDSLWMWGYNGAGQLGTNTWRDIYTPVKVLDNVAVVSVGGDQTFGGFTAAIKTDGSLWMWGANSAGQLGTGNRERCNIPTKVLDDVKGVSVGSGYTAAIKTDGSLWMWGYYKAEEIGTGKHHLTPEKVMDGVEVVRTKGAKAIIKTDGSLWMWGSSSDYGEFGFESFYMITSPVKVLDDVVIVSTNGGSTAIVKTDGSLWTCGMNSHGQLGYKGGTGVTDELYGGYYFQSTFKQVTGITVKIPKSDNPSQSMTKPSVQLTKQNLAVNGEAKNTEIYNIDGSNYFKLRDMAMLLNGTGSQFSVGYNDATKTISITTGVAYTPVGGELATGTDNSASAVASAQSIEINGQKVDLTAYNIGGYNFFKLRALGTALGFDVDYDTATATMIVTSK